MSIHTSSSNSRSKILSGQQWFNHLQIRSIIFQLLLLFWSVRGYSQEKKGGSNDNLLAKFTQLTIRSDEAEEVQLYKDFLQDYKKIKDDIAVLAKNVTLKNKVWSFIALYDIFPLFIKESRLANNSWQANSSGAKWYGQLRQQAIDDVSWRLKGAGVKTVYTPGKSGSDNILYSILYFSYLKNHVTDHLTSAKKTCKDSDIILFTAAAYNMWYSTRKTLYNAAGKPLTRDAFALYITKDLMKSQNKATIGTDAAYGVSWYKNRFGSADYTGKKTPLYNDSNGKTILTVGKWYETIRYCEMIHALNTHLDKQLPVYATISISKWAGLYKTIYDFLQQKEKEKKIKEGSTGNILIEKVLLDNGHTLDTEQSNTIATLAVSQEIILPYLIDTDFGKFSHTVTKYDSKAKKYFRSTVTSLMADKQFMNSLQKFLATNDNTTDSDDSEDNTNTARQMLMEAIIRYNQETRIGRNELVGDDVYIPNIAYFNAYEKLSEKETYHIKQEESLADKVLHETPLPEAEWTEKKNGSVYIFSRNDTEGKKVKEGPTSMSVKQIKNTTLGRYEKNMWKKTPTMIVIHGTESGKIGIHGISSMKAHFYIDYTGTIWQMTTTGTSEGTATNITYPAKIVALNHAGVGRQAKYWASRNGNDNKTYEAIGIEVASTETSKPNEAQYKALEKLITGLSTHYKIAQKNIITHQQIATSKRGRGRKADIYWFQREKIHIINNYNMVDQDVINGLISPNMKSQVLLLKHRWAIKTEIKYTLQGLNESIKRHRELVRKIPKTPTHNKKDRLARATLEELEKMGYF